MLLKNSVTVVASSDGMGTALSVSPSRWFGPSVGPNETASPVSEWVVVKTALSVPLPPHLQELLSVLSAPVSPVVRQYYLFLPLGHL